MASKKSAAPMVDAPTYAPPSWFVQCKNPWGARFVRAGFSHTPEMNHAFALGWPHAVELQAGHPDDADPVANASQWKFYGAVWPAEVAARWARLRVGHGYRRTPEGTLVVEPKGRKAVETAGPITVIECGAFLKKVLGTTDYLEDMRDTARILEASVGADAFCIAATEALEAASPEALAENDQERGFVVEHLGFALLRADEKLTNELRGRLNKLAAAIEAGPRDAAQVRTLHLILGGKTAAERCARREGDEHKAGKFVPGTRISVHDLRHVHDDPAYVAAAVRNQDPKFLLADPRLVFLAGADVADFYLEHAKRLRYDPPRVVLEMGAVKHPIIVKLIEQVARFREAKAIGTAWLAKYGT